MSSTTTSGQIGTSSIPLTDHDNQARAASDHWQVSQYFPIHPLGAHRWSRASDRSEKLAAAVSERRALDAIGGAGEKPRERLDVTVEGCDRRAGQLDQPMPPFNAASAYAGRTGRVFAT